MMGNRWPILHIFATRRVEQASMLMALGAFFLLPGNAAFAAASGNLHAFPAAEAGMERHVIELPQQPDESLFRVELMIGKTVKTDSVNRYFFNGRLETEIIDGWGFQRYILRELGPMAGTLMAVEPDAPMVERFVTLGGEAQLLRYNSRVPLVVYLPADVELRHRLWRAGPHPESTARFVRKLVLPERQAAVIAEGDWEARSIGSYSLRLYSTRAAAAPDDTTFFTAAITRPRDGMVEQVLLVPLGQDETPAIIVVIRSAGSGGYLSADAFSFTESSVALRGSVSGLSANADPVLELQQALTRNLKLPDQ
jgi:ecotin